MKNILHKIVHLLRLHHGLPDSHYKGERLIMCFKCGVCGKLEGCHEISDGWIDKEIIGDEVDEKNCVWSGQPFCKGLATKGSDYCSTRCWQESNVTNDGNSVSGRPV